ncbi:MAG TPA: hypothetical protein VGL78_10460 [Solirubrobacteraceae bacterium]|jgi:hypothetical protein
MAVAGAACPIPDRRRSLIRKHHHALAGTAHRNLLGPRPWWERLILWFGHAALWPTRIHPAQLLPVLVHDLELAGIAAASVTATVVAIVALRRVAVSPPVLPTSAAGRRRFELSLPDSFVRDGLTGFFRTVSLLLRPVLLGGQPSVSFAFIATGERLTITLECGAGIAPSIVATLEAAVDGISIDEIPAVDETSERRWARCTLRPPGSQWLPLESKHKVDPARFVLAALQCESDSELACVQAVFSPLSPRERRRGRREPRRLRTSRRGGMLAGTGRFGLEVVRDGAEIFLPGGSSSSTQTVRPAYTPDHWTLKQAGAIEEKTAEPLLGATIRLAVAGGPRRSKRWRLHALAASFGQFHALGGLRAGRELFGRRRFERRQPALRPPLAVTAAEAAALLPLPTNLAETRLAIGEAPARRLRPAADAPHSGIRLGRAER